MTEENYNYRTSQILLRNQFPGKGKLKIPIIPKFEAKQDDFDNLLLIGFDKTHLEDTKHLDRMVHFFLYDYRFERIWKNPDNDIEKLSRYRAVLSPDFSIYLEMAPVMQLYNVFRNRWCGAYWASKGMRVIPTVNWGSEASFDFCFEGIEKGSVVAVSTYMATEHGNRKDQKQWFLAGYNEMLRRIEPGKIVCYNTPFPEMQGDIVHVDYELSSWKYMSYNKKSIDENLDVFKIGGTPKPQYDTIAPFLDISKGGGSAYGGDWQPVKEDDRRFVGNPGDINRTTDRNGNERETKIGPDGRAIMERHHTDHGFPKQHSNPHDHKIDWESPKYGIPNFVKPQINYPAGNIPEFKKYLGGLEMSNIVYLHGHNTPEENRFKTISDFKDCMVRGGEVEFVWKGIEYGISHSGYKIIMGLYNQPDTTKFYETADEALEYIVSGDRLRDVITQVTVIDRTI
ncbi:MAG: DUF4417 domain-containing protein [Clostridiales bacterium]|nr:DUF4417 domain-containing protein [Clostridiales bacterium]